MKSNNKNKINNFIGKVKRRYREYMYEEETIKKLEEKDKLPFKQKFRSSIPYVITAVIILAVVAGISISDRIKEQKAYEEDKIVIQPSELVGQKRKIQSDELTRYMIDTSDDTYVKLAPTKLDDIVAYSLTYKYDVIPTEDMTATSSFVKGNMSSVLLNGYPYLTYKEMGLQNEEEAYIATQLAVYELVAREQYSGIANGEFSLETIVSADSQYDDMVERVIKKAKEIVEKASNNPYEEGTGVLLENVPKDFKKQNDSIVIGPFKYESTIDEYTMKYLNGEYVLNIDFDIKSFIDDSQVKIVDENGNEVKSVKSGESVYIKFNNNDEIFSILRTEAKTQYLYSRIYKTKECKKKYVTLESKELSYVNIMPLINNLKSGSTKISFLDDNNNIVSGISYYVYNIKDQKLIDVDGYGAEDEFVLPVGKYYIKIYDVPQDYFPNGETFEFEITENETYEVNVHMDSLKGLK